MKKAFLFIFSAIALLNLVSCYEDEGNYDYVDLQRFIVDTTGVNMSITVTQFDQLSVPSRLVYDGNKAHVSGIGIISNFTITGAVGNKATVDCTWTGVGSVTATPATPVNNNA